jgi:hypothetical protein
MAWASTAASRKSRVSSDLRTRRTARDRTDSHVATSCRPTRRTSAAAPLDEGDVARQQDGGQRGAQCHGDDQIEGVHLGERPLAGQTQDDDQRRIGQRGDRREPADVRPTLKQNAPSPTPGARAVTPVMVSSHDRAAIAMPAQKTLASMPARQGALPFPREPVRPRRHRATGVGTVRPFPPRAGICPPACVSRPRHHVDRTRRAGPGLHSAGTAGVRPAVLASASGLESRL